MKVDELPVVNKEYYDVYNYTPNLTKEEAHKVLKNALNKPTELIGYCKKCKSNGDLIIDFNGIGCAIKSDEVSPIVQPDTGKTHKGLCESKVGTNLKFRVVKFQDGVFFLSRKVIVAEQREIIKNELKVGDRIEGRVTAINENLGCFINIGADHTVLIPKKALEHIFVESISNHVKLGEVVTACITNIEKDPIKGEITNLLASRAAALPSYGELVSEFSEGEVIIGEVTAISNVGIYVKLTPHISASCRFKPNVYVNPGDRVRVKIKRITMTGMNKITGDIVSTIV